MEKTGLEWSLAAGVRFRYMGGRKHTGHFRQESKHEKASLNKGSCFKIWVKSIGLKEKT